MYEEYNSDFLYKVGILFGELILVNLLFGGLMAAGWLLPDDSLSVGRTLVLLSLSYAVCNIASGVVTHHRLVRSDQILRHVISNVLWFTLLTVSLILLLDLRLRPVPVFVGAYVALFFLILAHRMAWRKSVQAWRRYHHGRRVVFVGPLPNVRVLLDVMHRDASTGYVVDGYFDEAEDESLRGSVPYLGRPADAAEWISSHTADLDRVYCTLSSTRPESGTIMKTCDNHLIRFFVVPGVRTYMHNRMHFTLTCGVPVLSMRYEPLGLMQNKLLKRMFDIVCSLIFLCTLFPVILLIFGTAIKLSSPGPIFFKQKRSGRNGREFWCYKFRSMRVNAQSDSLQATKNDPRKTRIGEIMRRTNIDELPQFINVLRGEMSMVGPRPHMLKHTEEYSRLIDKYMVRHFAKPGITGWAQVTGYRGETKELWQMEGRVERDIWYIEHWTFALDLYIIYKTFANVIRGEKEAY